MLLYKKYLVEDKVFLVTGLAQSVERRPFIKGLSFQNESRMSRVRAPQSVMS